MGRIQELKDNRGTVRYEDRTKRMNAGPGPRYTAFVNVFAYDVVGEGDTKESSVANALTRLPAHVRRHFSV